MIRLAAFFTLSLLATSSLFAQPLRIVGSDMLPEPFRRGLAEFDSNRDDVTLSLSFPGSATALERLGQGGVDIGIIAVPDGQPLPQGYEAFPFAFDVAVVAVQESNPVRELTLQQLASVFSARASQPATTWGALGALGTMQSQSISAHIPGENLGITQSLFRRYVTDGEAFRNTVHRWEDLPALLAAGRQNSASLVVLPGNAIPQGMRAVLVAQADGVPYGPVDDSIFFGDYALRLPYYIVYRKADAAQLRETIAYLLSDEVAASLQASRLVPAPRVERREELLTL